jgi:trans-2-enoyl-CoA reductase
LAATGLVSTGASGNGLLSVVSAGFDSTIAATTIGVSFNGGASFAGTCTLVEAELRSYLA